MFMMRIICNQQGKSKNVFINWFLDSEDIFEVMYNNWKVRSFNHVYINKEIRAHFECVIRLVILLLLCF